MIKVFDKFIFDLMELFGMKPLGTKWSYLDDFNFSDPYFYISCSPFVRRLENGG